jgi:hypothetical protein
LWGLIREDDNRSPFVAVVATIITDDLTQCQVQRLPLQFVQKRRNCFVLLKKVATQIWSVKVSFEEQRKKEKKNT